MSTNDKVTTTRKSGDAALSSYPAGHSSAVLSSHASRDAYNSASHLLPYLKTGMTILDIGCGPGTISISFAKIVGPTGFVVGVDPSEDVIKQASERARSAGVNNVAFLVGDATQSLESTLEAVNRMTFDVVHANQVVQHVKDRFGFLREICRRANRPGGILSLREGDIASAIIYPEDPLLSTSWKNLYAKVSSSGGADPAAARQLHAYLRQIGVQPAEITYVGASAQAYGQSRDGRNATLSGSSGNGTDHAKAERQWWGQMWAQRTADHDGGFAQKAIQGGFATQRELDDIAQAWKMWSEHEDAYWVMIQCEVICVSGDAADHDGS